MTTDGFTVFNRNRFVNFFVTKGHKFDRRLSRKPGKISRAANVNFYQGTYSTFTIVVSNQQKIF